MRLRTHEPPPDPTRPASPGTAHTRSRGVRRSARVLDTAGSRAATDVAARKVATGRALIAAGLALLGASATLFAVALVASRALG